MKFGAFESDVHAFLAGGISATLNLENLERPLGRRIHVQPKTDSEGNYLPEWSLRVIDPQLKKDELRFTLRLEQLPPEAVEA
jgi:hypothetical protein